MELLLYRYNGTEVYLPNVESFEFRTNKVSNWIKVKFKNGDTGMFRNIATIKSI